MSGATFTIGEAAARAGVSRDTIRYYERRGLLPPVPRTAGGYRCYTDAAVARVLFVRNAIRFGLGVKELAGFLRARDSGRPPRPSRGPRGQGEDNQGQGHALSGRAGRLTRAPAVEFAAADTRAGRATSD